jgi:hypothetical protein
MDTERGGVGLNTEKISQVRPAVSVTRAMEVNARYRRVVIRRAGVAIIQGYM